MKILFDNNEVCKKCQSLWGFSAYISEYKLLFDTGSNGRVLLQNMHKLNVDVMEIKYLFLSHSHWDHIGGLDSIIELNPNITLFAPASLSMHLINDLKSMVKELIICGHEPMHLYKNLYTTGLLGQDMPEHSLIIDSDEPTVVTGCGHFGIENITKVAKDFLHKNVITVTGGFHLLNSDNEKILNTIKALKEMGVTYANPTHCSGDNAVEIFQDKFS